MRMVSLGIFLFAFWLLLSGHYTGLLITIGVVCCLGIVALASRMGVIDEEGHPVHLLLSGTIYWVWLLWEIAKSAWSVTLIILNPKLPVTPTLVKVRGTQKTRMGVNIYANSITLTPGTISIEVDGNDITVHAVAAEGAADLEEGVMDRRVTAMEGGK